MDEPAVKSFIAHEVKAAVTSSQNDLLCKIESMMGTKFNTFEHTMKDNNRQLSESQLSKIEELTSDSYTFKRKGTEEQYRVNAKVLSKVKEASNLLEDSTVQDVKIERASQKIDEGISILTHRQKLIKLADQSESGWKTVEEYESHSLADNSDDEKRIRRAESIAAQKIRVEKKGRKFRTQPYSVRSNSNSTTPQLTSTSITGRPGQCFECGVQGHWRRDHKSQHVQADMNKISTIFYSTCFHDSGLQDLNSCAYDGRSRVDDTPCWESSGDSEHGANVSPVGRLKSSIDEWKRISACDNVIDIIDNGYKLPLYSVPPDTVMENNKSAVQNPGFVNSELQRLIDLGCVQEVSMLPRIVNPLTVAENKKGKMRLVLDCRHINPHLFKFKVKYEDANLARHLFQNSRYLFSFDLKAAYHHISIFPNHRTFLGFSWPVHGERKYFVFCVLPFGVSTAGYIFTKVTKPMLKFWRQKGLAVIMYLDDGLGGCDTRDAAVMSSSEIQRDLKRLGFLIAEDKCQWEPTQNLIWLGLSWDMERGVIYVTPDRMSNLMQIINNILLKVASGVIMIKARRLASLVGQIISMQMAMGPVVRLKTRNMYNCLLGRAGWDAPVEIDSSVLDEIHFWLDNANRLNGNNLSEDIQHDYVVYSDASDQGYGGYLEGHTGASISGTWSDSEQQFSSTWRELEAVHRILMSLGTQLQKHNILWKTDNKNVVTILQNGSKKPKLQNIASKIFEFSKSMGIEIRISWIPRTRNTEADRISRLTDCDDWSIDSDTFNFLDAQWGPHTVDRFATNYNHKVRCFNSKFWCPGTAGVDAFRYTWQKENNWLVPPPLLVGKCIQKMKSEKANGTLVVPYWPSSPYWPLLISKTSEFYDFVTSFKVLESSVICRGKGLNLTGRIQDVVSATNGASAEYDRLSSNMSKYLLQSRSSSTLCKYYSAFCRWKDFITFRGGLALPGEPVSVALYITDLLDKGASCHVIQSAVYGIKWAHDISHFPDPTKSSFVSHLIETSNRISRPVTVKKDHISTNNIIELAEKYKFTDDLVVIRDLAIIVLGFSGFLRFNEISNLKCSDIEFHDSYLVVNIAKSKTDQYRMGNQIVIAQGESAACPVKVMEKYFRVGQLDQQSDYFLFRPLYRSGNKCAFISTNRQLSYSRTRECIVKRLKEVCSGLNVGLHSLRAGGATAAANSGVGDRCWKRHGRWKSETAKDGYVADSLEQRLEVTKKLGL